LADSIQEQEALPVEAREALMTIKLIQLAKKAVKVKKN